MSEKRNNKMTKEEYIHSMHRFGRRMTIITILFMLAIPAVAGIYFNAMPSISAVLTTTIGLLAIFIPTNLGEVIAYTPVVGSAVYLTFITGNLANLKLPVATNALKLMDISFGSEEADIFSSIAIGVSSFVTIIIIILGVVLMIPLQPILSLPSIEISTSYILPSLFGSLLIGLMNPNLGGGVTSPNRLKGLVVPTILVFIIAALDHFAWNIGIMSTYQGVVVIALLLMLYFNTKWLYNRGKINVYLPEDNE